MCFTKQEGTERIRLKRDVFLLKESIYYYTTEQKFTSEMQHFDYIAGHLYKKSIFDVLDAYVRRELEGQVFHVYNLRESKRKTNRLHVNSTFKTYRDYGLFMIPKGTIMYVNDDADEYDAVAFAIKYIGPLTKENSVLVTNQEDYN